MIGVPPAWWLFHVDMDAFLASVEVRRRPELGGRPVVVGGDGDPTRLRQVVATASYEARRFGVHSGMPLSQALRRCPDAVFLPSDHPAYDEASAEVMEALRSLGHPVEVRGWDEAFVGAHIEDPAEFARTVRDLVPERTRLTCAVGIGDTLVRAKMATGFAKREPERIFRLDQTNWTALLGDRPVLDLWGIGRRTAARLSAHGLHSVTDLADADRNDLADWFGPTIGPRLQVLAHGGGSHRISTEPWIPRSKSRQVTLPHDLTESGEIADHLDTMSRDLCAEVVADGRTVTHVAIVVRTASFYTAVKTGKLPIPTTDPDVVAEGARRVLGRFDIRRPVRLLGVRLDLAAP